MIYRYNYKESLDSLKKSNDNENINNNTQKEINFFSKTSNLLNQNIVQQKASFPEHEFNALINFDALNTIEQVNLVSK